MRLSSKSLAAPEIRGEYVIYAHCLIGCRVWTRCSSKRQKSNQARIDRLNPNSSSISRHTETAGLSPAVMRPPGNTQ